ENSKEHGESVPNSQMALYVLPLAAVLIEGRDPALAQQMRDLVPGLKKAISDQWQGSWDARAVLWGGNGRPISIDRDRINLQAQVWPLISGWAAETGREATLIEVITTRLDNDKSSRIGCPLVEGGEVWPAVSQLLTWGYTRSRPDLAWRSFKCQ